MDKHYRCAGRVRQPIMSKACKSQKKTQGASLTSCLPGLDYCLLVILDHAVVACWSLEERPQAAAVVLSRARLKLCTYHLQQHKLCAAAAGATGSTVH